MQSKDYQIRSRIWITTEDGTFLGEGRISLLKEIDKHGSISKAAQAMQMSYKKAWNLVDSMNKQAPELLVSPKAGGTGGGGSIVSESGHKAIKLFNEISEANRRYLDERMNKVKFT